jgi:hypothetical protein
MSDHLVAGFEAGRRLMGLSEPCEILTLMVVCLDLDLPGKRFRTKVHQRPVSWTEARIKLTLTRLLLGKGGQVFSSILDAELTALTLQRHERGLVLPYLDRYDLSLVELLLLQSVELLNSSENISPRCHWSDRVFGLGVAAIIWVDLTSGPVEILAFRPRHNERLREPSVSSLAEHLARVSSPVVRVVVRIDTDLVSLSRFLCLSAIA